MSLHTSVIILQMQYYMSLVRSYSYNFIENTKVVVTGGRSHYDAINRVESFDLKDITTTTCQSISKYPHKQFGMSMGLIQGMIKSCGGYRVPPKNRCYDYHPVNNTWVRSTDMLSERWYHGHSSIDNVWFLSGGNNVQPLSTTEMWDGKAFIAGPPLPRGMYAHCQLTVNHTHVFIATGDQQPSYLLYWPDWTWTEMPPMQNTYEGISCGLIQNPGNGYEAVIVALQKNEIFNFKNLTWRNGPPVPKNFTWAGYTQLSDTFLVIGGKRKGDDQFSNEIYKFDNINYKWVLLGRHLQTGVGYYPGVVTIPDNFLNCT